MRTILRILLLVLLPATTCRLAAAAELEFDVSYGTTGTTVLGEDETLGGSVWGYIEMPVAVQILADGSVLFAGITATGSTRVLKIGIDGRPDAGFGRGGRLEVPLGSASNGSSPALAVDARGRILVAGAAPAGKDAAGADLPPRARVLRLAADGTPDPAFGDGGVADQAIVGAEGPPRAVRLALDLQQRIRVVASCDATARDSNRPCAVQSWRLLADGRVDAAFAVSALPGPGGSAPNVVVSFPIAVASVEGDASFVLLEEPEDILDNRERLLRILPDGRVDASFDGGVAGQQVSAILGTGRELYLSRTVLDQRAAAYAASLLRLTASGMLDAGFGANGSLPLHETSPGSGTAFLFHLLAADGDDAVLTAGRMTSPATQSAPVLLARIAPLGAAALDRGFGRDGRYALPFATPGFVPRALRRDAAGRLVLAGLTYSRLSAGIPTVARLVTGPALPGKSAGVIGFGVAPEQVRESAGTLRVQVIRAGGARGPASVDYSLLGLSASEGSDFRALRGRLDWADGDGGDRFIDMTILDDGVAEPLESLQLRLQNATGAALAGQPGLALTIVDDDPTAQTTAPPAPAPGPATAATGGGGGFGGVLLWALSAWLIARGRRLSAWPRRSATRG